MMNKFANGLLLSASVLGTIALAGTAQAQEGSAGVSSEDIIVTARRVEENLRDVPISISVLSQAELSQNNLTNMSDLATVTPGLQLNSRYGNDAVSFTIRGFTQEVRTYSTVGIYFADVVAPRGSGATMGGDGAGPGALFDLQNVQVLKGPQGTLFGRNTSGGAVLLVPRKPTGRFEGYVEGTVGDDDLRRVQAVVNIPMNEAVRIRVGLDRQTRDGYLRNVGTVGDGKYDGKGIGNSDYWALRMSMVVDVTPDIENYTVATWTKSQSNGLNFKLFESFPARTSGGLPTGRMAQEQIAREAPFGPWAVSNRVPDAASDSKQWQVINTTTWRASDNLTIKNILSYGEFRNVLNQDVFGSYFIPLGANPATIISPNQVTGIAVTHVEPFSRNTNAQSSLIEELQFQGSAAAGRFTWQAGGYLEINDPLGFSGQQSYNLTGCVNPLALQCAITPGFSLGSAGFQRSKSKYRDYAIYGQASFAVTDQFKLTGGLRYTWDKQDAIVTNQSLTLSTQIARCRNGRAPGFGQALPLANRANQCFQNLSQDSKAPTWMVMAEYKPIEDIMVYAKWSRGYRQGGLALFSPDPLQNFTQEKVDVYEVGFKSSWRGAVPGNFDIFGYYNDFRDQQLMLSITDVFPNVGRATELPSTTIVNAGASRMYGFEVDFGIRPFEGLSLHLGYAYVNTRLKEFTAPSLPADSPWDTLGSPVVGGPIPGVTPHQLTVSGNYTLPLPESVGEVSLGAVFSYNSKYRSTNDQVPGNTWGILPSAKTLNLNFDWKNVAQLPIDLGVFVTNATNEVNYTFVNVQELSGFVSHYVAPPRRWGLRLKYKFGE